MIDDRNQFTLIGTKFENLQIAGCKRSRNRCRALQKIPTFEAAIKEYKNNAEFRRMAKTRSNQKRYGRAAAARSHSLLYRESQENEDSVPGVDPKGHCFIIPSSGNSSWERS